MLAMTRSMLALGALGAMALGTSAPAAAQGVYVETPFGVFGFGAPLPGYYVYRVDPYVDPYGSYAYVPRYRNGRALRYYNWTPHRPMERWDPYGKRWDGAG